MNKNDHFFGDLKKFFGSTVAAYTTLPARDIIVASFWFKGLSIDLLHEFNFLLGIYGSASWPPCWRACCRTKYAAYPSAYLRDENTAGMIPGYSRIVVNLEFRKSYADELELVDGLDPYK